ncbi:MAG: (Fe-S)-binding protein [Bradymonadales bacterium]|nr:(Fe-S)-binding protein [Bradymonadales bacterium]
MSRAPSRGTLDFTDAERKALRYCTYCPKLCRFACPVAHGEARETVTPWGLMRLLNLVDGGHLPRQADLIEPLYHCISCGRCQVYCRHDSPVAEILAKGRAALVADGLEVPVAFDPVPGGCQADAVPPPYMEGRTDRPAFLPSCASLQGQGGAERVRRAMEVLNAHGAILAIPKVERFVGCGFCEWEAGRVDRAVQSWQRFVDQAAAHPQCVTDCGQALWAFQGQTRKRSQRVLHLVEWLSEHLYFLPEGHLEGPVVVHDSSFETRRLGLGDEFRQVVERLCGQKPLSLHESGRHARSCGSGGLWGAAFPEARARATQLVLEEILDSGARTVVAASPHCRAGLREQIAVMAAIGSQDQPIEVFDLLDLLVAAGETDRCGPPGKAGPA